MDEKTTNENPFKPLICHRIIRKKASDTGRMEEVVCGAPALRYYVTGTKLNNAAKIPFTVTVWLCKVHHDAAKKEGYTLKDSLTE